MKRNTLANGKNQLTSTLTRAALLVALSSLLGSSHLIAGNNNAPASGNNIALGSLVAPADPKDAQAFREAIAYLSRSAKAREIISYLENCQTSYRVVAEFAPIEGTAQPGDGFVPNDAVIYWRPNWAFRWNTGLLTHKQTAALALIHEMGHAYHAASDPARYEQDCKLYSDSAQRDVWTSPEEKRTIKEIENVVSKELNEPLTDRHDWSGVYVWATHYPTIGPVSTVEQKSSAADASQFSNLGIN